MKHAHKKHHGSATKSVKHEMHGSGKGSNLSLPTPKQSMHVAPQKDKMAANVSNHMQPSKGAMGHQDLQESGGGKLGHHSEKY